MPFALHEILVWWSLLGYSAAFLTGLQTLYLYREDRDYAFGDVMCVFIDYVQYMLRIDLVVQARPLAQKRHLIYISVFLAVCACFFNGWLVAGNKLFTDNALSQGVWVSIAWQLAHLAGASAACILHVALIVRGLSSDKG
ncbi:MAG: hypothetical protein AAGF20_00300 [Pseudomonadota bacterium]